MLKYLVKKPFVIKIDQEKAFDRVSHQYIFNVLKKFGFGDVFIKWIMIFYNKINSTVKCNGFLTKYFNIENGIRQGCPISAFLEFEFQIFYYSS
jgi:hypothetical protein